MLGTAKGYPERNLDLEPNSKPYLLKRLISDGFDTVAVFLLFMALAMALFASPLGKTYNEHYTNYMKVYSEVIEQFGDDTAAINDSLQNNAYFLDERFAAQLHGYILNSAAVFVAEVSILLIVPLVSKKRKTPGKMLAGVLPFSERKHALATRGSIFGRFLFIFFIDSLFLYLYAGIFAFLLVPVIRLIEMLLNKKNKTICDAVSGVMIIEQSSYDGID